MLLHPELFIWCWALWRKCGGMLVHVTLLQCSGNRGGSQGLMSDLLKPLQKLFILQQFHQSVKLIVLQKAKINSDFMHRSALFCRRLRHWFQFLRCFVVNSQTVKYSQFDMSQPQQFLESAFIKGRVCVLLDTLLHKCALLSGLCGITGVLYKISINARGN